MDKQISVKLKYVIKELKLKPDDKVFIRFYKKPEEQLLLVSEINSAILDKPVKLIQHHYGGRKYEYNCYRFILT